MSWKNMLKKDLLSIRRSFDKAYPNLFDKIITIHSEMKGYLERLENIVVDLHSKLELEIPLDVIMDEIVMSIIEVRRIAEINFDYSAEHEQPLEAIVKVIPTEYFDAVTKRVMNALRFSGGYEFDDRTKVLTTFLKDLNVELLIKLLILGMYIIMEFETGKKVSKSKGVAVTAGKTKTVNMPIVEDDDNDCMGRFERVCDEYATRFDTIVESKIKDLLSIWNSNFETMALFGSKYKNKLWRNTASPVRYEKKDIYGERLIYKIFSKDSLKLQFYFDGHWKSYLRLMRERGVPDELVCVVAKEFVDAFINGSTTKKEFMFQGKPVHLTCAVEKGVTNEHSQRFGLYFMHDNTFYSLLNFMIGFDRSHYSSEAYDNQEKHGKELWIKIAGWEMEKFVTMLGSEFS
tara:strand:- start:2443 stop:3651 length:1209 start_codon:yes stop_codon:yes gene_type:complete